MSFLETYGQDLAENLFRQGYNKIQITQTLAEHARLFASSQTAWSSVLNSPGRIAAGSLVLFSSEPEAFLRMFFGSLAGAPRFGAVGATRITSEIFNRVPLPDRLKFLRNRVEPNGSEIWTQVAISMFVGTAALAQGIQSLSAAICGVSPVLAPSKLSPVVHDPFSRIGVGYNRDWLSPETCFQTVNGPATFDLVSPWDAGYRLLKPWDFVTGRFSVPVRVGHDLLVNENFYGEEFESDSERVLHAFQAGVLPIGAEELAGVFTGNADEPRLGLAATVAQAATGTNFRAPTTSAGRDWRARLYAEANGLEGVNGWGDLTLVEKRELFYDPNYLAERIPVIQGEVDRYGTDSGQARLLRRFTIDGRYLFSRYEQARDLIVGLFDPVADHNIIRAQYNNRVNTSTARRIDALNLEYGNYGEAETSEIDGQEQVAGYVNQTLEAYFNIIDQSTIGTYQDGFDSELYDELITAFYEQDPGRELVVESHRDAFPLPDFVRKIDDLYDELSELGNAGNSLLRGSYQSADSRTALLRAGVLEILRQDNILSSDIIDGLFTGNLPEDAVEQISETLKGYFEPTLIGLAEAEIAENAK